MKKIVFAFALVLLGSFPAFAKGWDTATITGINVGNDMNGNGSVEVYTNPITVYVDGVGYTSVSQWAFPLTGSGTNMLTALTDAFKAYRTVPIYTSTSYYTYAFGSWAGNYSRVRILAVGVGR